MEIPSVAERSALKHVSSVSQQVFFERIFLLMGLGLALTGFVAYVIGLNDAWMSALFSVSQQTAADGTIETVRSGSAVWTVAALTQFLMVFAITWKGFGRGMSAQTALLLFTIFAVLNGITLAPVLAAYTTASVAKVFFITAISFAGSALWGMTTKRDMTGMGRFFLQALIGLLVAMVVNLFLRSPAMDFLVSSVAVLLFAALTAYDMQMLRKLHESDMSLGGAIAYGALTLYLDFMNMFLHLLRFFGISRD